MYVRLAFAVAAHLEPEILIVDEVLAVGDYEFQQKCLGKMEEVARGGRDKRRTVLFVSHNMRAVSNLCRRAIWIDSGRVRTVGSSAQIIREYLAQSVSENSEVTFEILDNQPAQFRSVRLLNKTGRPKLEFAMAEPIVIEMALDVRERLAGSYITMSLHTPDGVQLLFSEERDSELAARVGVVGDHILRVTIPGDLLAPGRFLINLGINSSFGVCHNPKAFVSFEVTPGDANRKHWPGLIAPRLLWEPCNEIMI